MFLSRSFSQLKKCVLEVCIMGIGNSGAGAHFEIHSCRQQWRAQERQGIVVVKDVPVVGDFYGKRLSSIRLGELLKFRKQSYLRTDT